MKKRKSMQSRAAGGEEREKPGEWGEREKRKGGECRWFVREHLEA